MMAGRGDPWRLAARATLVAACVLWSAPARGHVVSDRDLKVVARLPAAATHRLAESMPDSAGYVRPNRADGWRGVGFQRGAVLLLVHAAAHADSLKAERAWAAIERAFEFQRPDGSFQSGSSESKASEMLAAGMPGWLAGVSRALIAVMNSRLQNRFRWRYALLKPKLQRAVDALERGHLDFLQRHARRSALLMSTAAALLLADGIYHDERYGRAGQRALMAALSLQRTDGLFPTNGRPDPDEHTVGLGALQAVAIYFPSPTLERSSDRARRWLERRTGSWASRSHGGHGIPELTTPGEVDFVLAYGALRPPPPTPIMGH